MSTDTSWITPGAEIVVYRDTYNASPDPIRTTVEKVAKASFTVADVPGERFKFDTLQGKRYGSSYFGWSYVAIHPSDPKVNAMFAQQRRERTVARAVRAVAEWNTGHGRGDRAKLDAAIDALVKYRAELTGGDS